MKTRMKQYLVVAMGVVGLMGSRVWAANTNTIDATITVSPVANVSLSLSNPTWAIGAQNVNTSTVSWQPMNLANTGDIDITVTAKILDQSPNWTANATSTTTLNNYMLYVATSAAVPNPNGLQFAAATIIGALNDTPIPLRGLSGTGVGTIATGGGNVNLYYRLDMPTHVTTSVGRTTHVEYTGTAN